jgi:hypothetical protein
MILFQKISYLPQWIILSVDMEWSFLWMFRLYLIESYGIGFELNMHFNVIVLTLLNYNHFLLDISLLIRVSLDIRHLMI